MTPGRTAPELDTDHYRVFAGGKGFNQSIALARAGARVARHWAIELREPRPSRGETRRFCHLRRGCCDLRVPALSDVRETRLSDLSP
jgi:hypothetical protein